MKINQAEEKRARNEAFALKHKASNKRDLKKEARKERKLADQELEAEFWNWEHTNRRPWPSAK